MPTIYFDALPEDGLAFDERCARSASALRELGIGQGEVVALMLHNEPVLLELMLAARAVGAHCCLINWHFKAAEARHILSDSKAKALIVHANLLEQIRDGIPSSVRIFVEAPRQRTRTAFGIEESHLHEALKLESWHSHRDAGSRPAPVPGPPGSVMVYTSGTTGLPKGIRREPPSPEQVEQGALSARIVLGIETGMRALVSAPMYHSAPANYVQNAALQDAHLWIEPRFDAQETLRLIDSQRITHAYLVPTMFRRLLRLPAETRARYDFGSLKFVACTGAPFPPEIKRSMIDWWGPVIHEGYAASELGWITHIDSQEALRKPGSVGRALPGTVVKVLSALGDELPPGATGLIYARSAAVPDFTYANNDQARRRLEHNGLWTLGDMGFLDPEGYLYVVDRQSDMVISGGVNIYPAEIEAVLASMPGVADCAVFGVPDEEFGEALLAAVQPVLGASLTIGQVQSFLRERIANYKVPRSIVFHDSLPREDTGKIFKRKLREPYWEAVARRV
jgi:long-chain acyl-CoA synthetase